MSPSFVYCGLERPRTEAKLFCGGRLVGSGGAVSAEELSLSGLVGSGGAVSAEELSL